MSWAETAKWPPRTELESCKHAQKAVKTARNQGKERSQHGREGRKKGILRGDVACFIFPNETRKKTQHCRYFVLENPLPLSPESGIQQLGVT